MVLRDDSGLPSLTIVNAVAKMAPLPTPQESSGDDLSSKLVALSDLIAAVDSDFSKTCTILNNKIKALERTLASAPLALPTLTLSMPVQDDHGIYVTTLRGILEENSSLKQSNVRLTRQIEKLSANVTAQGGVVMGRYAFTLELQLIEVFMKKCLKGDAFAAFVDPMTIFCFDPSYTPISGWERLTKAMEKSGSYPVTDRKVVASYDAHHSH